MMTLSLVVFFLMRVNKPKGFRSFSSSILFGSQMTYFNPRIKAKQSKTQNWKLMFVRGGWVDVQFPSVQCWYLYPLCPVLTGHWSAQECDKSPPTNPPAQPSPAQAEEQLSMSLLKFVPAAWPSARLNSALLETLGFIFDIDVNIYIQRVFYNFHLKLGCLGSSLTKQWGCYGLF